MDLDSTNPTPDELRRRWELTGSPQLLLQTAEAFRREGRLAEGVGLLERGLEQNPDHTSALVALGRFRLELGELEAAAVPLQRVIGRDATHFVANKLLAETYLRLGRLRDARDRLDFYTLMNEDDPDIERLEAEMEVAEEPILDRSLESGVAPDENPPGPDEKVGGDVFNLDALGTLPVAAAPSKAVPGDSEGRVRIRSQADPFALFETEPVEDPIVAPALEHEETPPEDELDTVVGADTGADPAASSAERVTGLPVSPAEVDFSESEEELQISDPAARTATLGKLYLFQGHHREAESIFREVLAREPYDGNAWDGLRQTQQDERLWLTSAELMHEAEGKALASGTSRERKILLMARYLEQIRSTRSRLGQGEVES